MTEPRRTPIPDQGPEDVEPSELTRVRPRTPAPESPQSGEWPSFASLQQPADLVRSAQALLDALPPNHPRAQLLRTAIVRRDEIVLLRLIEELRTQR